MKRCAKCQGDLPLADFYMRKNGYVSPRCKPCTREDIYAARAENPERHRAASKRWYEANRESATARMRAWAAANPEKVRAARGNAVERAEATRQWRLRNPERAAELGRRWHSEHRDQQAAYQREWKAKNPGRSAENLRKWRAANPDRHLSVIHARRAAKRSLNWGDVTPDLIATLRAAFGHRCAYCQTAEADQLDHYIPLKLGGLHAIDNLVPACRSCNASKGATHPDVWLQTREKV